MSYWTRNWTRMGSSNWTRFDGTSNSTKRSRTTTTIFWTLYCLTDINQWRHPLMPPAPGPFPQATLYLSNPKNLQNSPKGTSPIYMMMDNSKRTSAPPFILVGSNIQEAQDWFETSSWTCCCFPVRHLEICCSPSTNCCSYRSEIPEILPQTPEC